MDLELRGWLKELASQLLKSLDKTENGTQNEQCDCKEIFKDISA